MLFANVYGDSLEKYATSRSHLTANSNPLQLPKHLLLPKQPLCPALPCHHHHQGQSCRSPPVRKTGASGCPVARPSRKTGKGAA